MFFFNDTATTEIYTLSLHDALPICSGSHLHVVMRCRYLSPARHVAPARYPNHERDRPPRGAGQAEPSLVVRRRLDRKSTRLNSSHANISYAVFCLKKKTNNVLSI